MGMDLKPINPSPDAPRYPSDHAYDPNGLIWGRYNWSGWSELLNLLESWHVDVTEFSGYNDGNVLSAETCAKVADAIEQNIANLPVNIAEWLHPHIARWRTCGGYEQW